MDYLLLWEEKCSENISFFFFSSFFRLCVCVVSAKIDWLSYFWPIIIMLEIFYRNFMSSIISGVKQTLTHATQRTQPTNFYSDVAVTPLPHTSSKGTQNTVLTFANMCRSAVSKCARDFLFHSFQVYIFVFASAVGVCASHTNQFVSPKPIHWAWAHHVTNNRLYISLTYLKLWQRLIDYSRKIVACFMLFSCVTSSYVFVHVLRL